MWNGARSVVGSGIGQLGPLGEHAGNTETDLSNLAVAAGVVGIVAGILLYAAFVRGASRALSAGRIETVAPVLVLISCVGHWLNPGSYGMTIVAWLALGTVLKVGGSPHV
jgi:hypothetical protein